MNEARRPDAAAPSDDAWSAISPTPPVGCQVDDAVDGVRLRASYRSLKSAGIMTLVSLFWNGILGIFVALVVAAIISHRTGAPPAWFPVNDPDATGPVLPFFVIPILIVFLLPFVGIGLLFVWTIVVCIAGHVEVAYRGPEGTATWGVGPFVRRRRFDTTRVSDVQLVAKRVEHEAYGDRYRRLAIEADRTLIFGGMLPVPAKQWLRDQLRARFVQPEHQSDDAAAERP